MPRVAKNSLIVVLLLLVAFVGASFLLRKPVVTPGDLRAAAAGLYEGTPPSPPNMETCVLVEGTPVQVHGVLGAEALSSSWAAPPLADEAAVRRLMEECGSDDIRPTLSPLSRFDEVYVTMRLRELERDPSDALELSLRYHEEVLGLLRSGTDTAFDGLSILKPLHHAIAALLSRHPALALDSELRAYLQAQLSAFPGYELLQADRARSAHFLLEAAVALPLPASRFDRPLSTIPLLTHARVHDMLPCEDVGERECKSRIDAVTRVREHVGHPLAIMYWLAGQRVEQDYLIDRAIDNEVRVFFRYHQDLEAALGELVMLQEIYQAWSEARRPETVVTPEWTCRITQAAVGSNARATRVGGPCGRMSIGGHGRVFGLLAVQPAPREQADETL